MDLIVGINNIKSKKSKFLRFSGNVLFVIDYQFTNFHFFFTELNNKPRKPPLEIAMAHAQELVRLMSNAELGSCAFASVKDLLEH